MGINRAYILKAIVLFVIGIAVLFAILTGTGTISVGLSAYHHHRLNEAERLLFDAAVLRFRERLERGEYDQIRNEIADSKTPKNEIIDRMKEARERFGRSLGHEFFRSSPPEPAARYYNDLPGNYYRVMYFTRTEKGEFGEAFQWVVDDKNGARILGYSGSEIQEWEISTRTAEAYYKEVYSSEVKIPFGDRFIEIRY